MQSIAKTVAMGLAILLPATTLANVGGGARIHSAATLTYVGGEVTAFVDVTVETVASAPLFTVDDAAVSAFAGNTVVLAYTVTSTSNGVDDYSLSLASADTDVGAPDDLSLSSAVLTLGASITSQPSDAGGNLYIPAGSENGFAAGDLLVVDLGGTTHVYEVDTVTPGTPASTSGSVTTPETPTRLQVTPVSAGAPVIGAATVPAGTQLGERQSLSVTVINGVPDTVGVNGQHLLEVSGSTTALDTSGATVNFADGLDATITVLSGDATLTKEVRNVTRGGGFATSGVTAMTGDELEYRITMEPIAGTSISGAVLEDTVPVYTEYLANSTTLNGDPVADSGTTDFPLDEGGISVNSPGAAAGDIIDGDQAVVLFRVLVD